MRKLILAVLCAALLVAAITFKGKAQTTTTIIVPVPDSLKPKTALFYGVWVAAYNDSTRFIIGLNNRNQILFGKMRGKDSIDVINQGVWKVKPNMAIAEIEVAWLMNPGQGSLFYHEQGDHYLFIKAAKFYYDSLLSRQIALSK